ncbi:universal stress protein [uncultured Paludibaculum sp.]|uniref:universal stress protein n=1 Tax=uncultured Paludibaculum sp. TaxID=1765020 RepID=UPI002AABE8CF|nr:universal stress protein [uncultured Paludibaculum sp.]
MLLLKSLLLPIDYSPRSLDAAGYVRALATRCDPEVTVLHVIGQDAPRDAANDVVDAINNLLGGLKVVFTAAEGDPARCIVEYAQSHGVDLIMMPTHGYGVLRRFLLGSVTAKVLHDTDRPVWTCMHAEKQIQKNPTGIRAVACAVDLGPHSPGLLRWASDLAASYDARLIAIHASTQLEPVIGVVHDPEWRAHVSDVLWAQLSELVRKSGVTAELKLTAGEAAKAVALATRETGADVLVIGRTPDGLMGRLRTNTYAIIRQSPCPVVSI